MCAGIEYHSDLVLQHLKALTFCMIVCVFVSSFWLSQLPLVQTASKEAVYLVGLTYFRLVSFVSDNGGKV